MPVGDVWILGAGASADSGAPTFADYRRAAGQVAASATVDERKIMQLVLDFWDQHMPFLNIEQFFGFVDSKDLSEATGEGDLSDLRAQTLFLIAKVLSEKVKGRGSGAYRQFLEIPLEEFVPVITLNWDILLEEALLAKERKVDYSIPHTRPWDPHRTFRGPQLVFKLHGSLNWIHCQACRKFTFLDVKTPVVEFLRTGKGLTCESCQATEGLSVMIVPPVLAKLSGNDVLGKVWTEAYKVLRQARQVFIVGYSFPVTDLQTRLFIQKALHQAPSLDRIYVVTKPKFGSARARFEDTYIEALGGAEIADRVYFDYRTFSQFVNGGLRG